MKKITLCSSGEVVEGSKTGGYATLLLYSAKERVLCAKQEKTTRNRMELTGVIEGLRALKEPCDVDIVTVSVYLHKGIDQWFPAWIQRDFTNVKNVDLWQEYLHVSQGHTVTLNKGASLNYSDALARCQELARVEASR